MKALSSPDGADHIALIVVRRIDHGLVRELEQAPEKGFVLGARVAILKVRASGAADQQRVAREHAVRHEEAVRIVGVPWRIGDVEAQAFDVDAVVVGDAN